MRRSNGAVVTCFVPAHAGPFAESEDDGGVDEGAFEKPSQLDATRSRPTCEYIPILSVDALSVVQ